MKNLVGGRSVGTSTERNRKRKRRKQNQKDREQDAKKILEELVLERKEKSTARD